MINQCEIFVSHVKGTGCTVESMCWKAGATLPYESN